MHFFYDPTVHEDNTIYCHPLVRISVVTYYDPHTNLFWVDNLQEFGCKCIFILLFRFLQFLLLQRLLFTWDFIPGMNAVITFHHWPIWLNLNSSLVWSSLFFFFFSYKFWLIHSLWGSCWASECHPNWTFFTSNGRF